ncbi:PH domain-containing protein [Gracilibacillus alcaliphilus]|uniref:PH domain-containing protein n=1 Tax=Gracilibacillus alcaliphilus TaxID=1401441 RepID=UPI00195B67E7|nr:PH domain-containing protein [Gracilibacillus alcaliphilus]MBM7676356.1 membrane protein YdbS with pleckstrin-like domain [Gracilibacillus alcaliphilus]
MREQPNVRIAKDAIKAWQLTAHLFAIISFIITIAAIVLYFYVDFVPGWLVLAIAGVTIVEWVVTAFIIPKLRWRRWRYQIYDQEIYIQHGILIVTRTLVPMIRVQHVDTQQGPILKKYGLATLEISTAATTHQIPALLEEEASELRDQISELARVEQDDV